MSGEAVRPRLNMPKLLMGCRTQTQQQCQMGLKNTPLTKYF